MERGVSIHAPHAGRDRKRAPQCSATWIRDVSIHALPTRGATMIWKDARHGMKKFQLRGPRGRDEIPVTDFARYRRFNPRAPTRGATPFTGADRSRRCPRSKIAVSIHAPHAGRDDAGAASTRRCTSRRLFQSTRPTRGATICAYSAGHRATFCARGFNPRAPRGARRQLCRAFFRAGLRVAVSTPRAPRGARRSLPQSARPAGKYRCFQSTRPTRGDDRSLVDGDLGADAPRRVFNPRAPRGARLARSIPLTCDRRSFPSVSIHAPHAGRRDSLLVRLARARVHTVVSIHAPHAGRDSQQRPAHAHLGRCETGVSIQQARHAGARRGFDLRHASAHVR